MSYFYAKTHLGRQEALCQIISECALLLENKIYFQHLFWQQDIYYTHPSLDQLFQVLDYSQFALSLSKSNTEDRPVWDLHYNFSSYFQTDVITAESMDRLYDRLVQDRDMMADEGESLTQRYLMANTGGVEHPSNCPEPCLKVSWAPQINLLNWPNLFEKWNDIWIVNMFFKNHAQFFRSICVPFLMLISPTSWSVSHKQTPLSSQTYRDSWSCLYFSSQCSHAFEILKSSG